MGKMEDILKVVYKKKKSKHLDSVCVLARACVRACTETKKRTQINDKNTVMKNRFFDTVVNFDMQ
jgi:hypothetical protein